MKPSRLFTLVCLSTACVVGSTLRAQVAPTPAATADSQTDAKDEILVLSPFTVTTDKDTGYRATNTISGTRLNTPIKDLPMPIEVITEEFLRDTGSTDLRQSLRYSSGVLLQTQNDYSAPAGSFSVSPGKINNPEGLTSSATQTNMKIRGFQTESVLRDGFRRQNSTDAVNISRVEIARGPASLLYGVGNFGGVVNYLVKMPSLQRSTDVSFTYGSYDFMRATLDTTGALGSSEKAAYRLTAAWQDQGSYEDFNEEHHTFISPVVTWRPFQNTEILFDLEYGRQKNTGIGWKSLRAAVSGFVNDSAGYDGSFYPVPGKDVRTFRWSGPDTYRDSEAGNLTVKLTQKIADNLHFLVGVNRSTFQYEQLDNMAAFRRDTGPAWARGPVTFDGLTDTQSGVPVGPQSTSIAYQWELADQNDTHDQLRAELNYTFNFFEDSTNRWLGIKNSFLAGYTYTEDTARRHTHQTPGDVANYHNPTDYSYFRYGRQGDGSADHALVEWDNGKSVTSNPAYYAVYQGRFLDDRLMLIGGARRDRSWNHIDRFNPQYRSNGTPGGDTVTVHTPSLVNRDTTYQWGVSLAVTPKRDVSLYAMRSDGVQPNYQGKLDLYGQPLQAALARNDEFGVKFDLLDGKLSGTISKFEITRTRAQVGSSSLVWFAPVVSDNLNFDPTKDIVYRVDDLNPATNGWNAAVVDSTAQWNAAIAAGAVYQATNSAGETHWYANASKTTGAAFMDAIFNNVHARKQYGWWGWIYGGADPGSLPFDNLVNNATMDDNGAQKSVATGSDRAKGWDTQIIWSPTKNLQVLFTWSHIEKTVINAQAWPKYPYPQDRWAIWYAPISWAATAGRPLNEVYSDPNDTSTFVSFGAGLPLDDTPENHGTFWVNYKFDQNSSLQGLSLGLGGYYESERSVYPSYGRNALDTNGDPIFLSTPSRRSLNAMVRYEFSLRDRPASVQLNVENLTNDRKLYGFIYAAPRRWQLQFDYKL
jgi:iron complex outermembrane recepter protein